MRLPSSFFITVLLAFNVMFSYQTIKHFENILLSLRVRHEHGGSSTVLKYCIHYYLCYFFIFLFFTTYIRAPFLRALAFTLNINVLAQQSHIFRSYPEIKRNKHNIIYVYINDCFFLMCRAEIGLTPRGVRWSKFKSTGGLSPDTTYV